ncbi:hypothetical protein [Streptomyces sp. G-G2]|uniref:hypothetical protein n=1 Tax=Streptomyces sp. G-G2 TaxID=3046201 RepID=UPI0024B919FD|nr:hypothetical protein [Streptomyces sp. G-G2]MDJ0386315.1 hypothetical protein [Streptomyces sp. G-G2]
MTDEAPEVPSAAPSAAVPGVVHGEPAGVPADAAHEPAGPAPLGVVRTPTGHAPVDAGLERLADADHLAADGHVEVYEDVHRGLRDELTALDAPPPGPSAGPASATPYDLRS